MNINENVPFNVTALFLLIVGGIIFLIFMGLNFALRKLAHTGRTKVLVMTMAVIFGWLGFLALLAAKGFFMDFMALPPHIAVAILPPVVFILLIGRTKAFKNLLIQIPQAWIIGCQSFRILMEVCLWGLFLSEIIPVQMSFEGLNFDVLTGLTALIMIWILAKNRNQSKGIIIGWNIAGLCLLLNIVLIALLSTPSPLQQFHNEPANTIIGYMPWIWLPGFVVPFAFALHVFSIRKALVKGVHVAP